MDHTIFIHSLCAYLHCGVIVLLFHIWWISVTKVICSLSAHNKCVKCQATFILIFILINSFFPTNFQLSHYVFDSCEQEKTETKMLTVKNKMQLTLMQRNVAIIQFFCFSVCLFFFERK